eukprot:11197772-Lingulodinium_polyedra.AAC.1
MLARRARVLARAAPGGLWTARPRAPLGAGQRDMAPAALRRARVRSIQAAPPGGVGGQAAGERRRPGGHPQRHRR